ncbi:chromosome partitioning protein ParA [Mangrovactinospora gilvigrisea]|uniref:Chromosome partitioning protein ParA n=1 Tax=Mangrovactinospora gilvigrisea TaxID=1428644 RepID=A0A1J7C102_9ACTN|nr:chromosome partitioning protein ParA [Mangrovactinospora gilvigrisea]
MHPFRGLRYNPAKVSSLGNVTSPPYDVIEPDGVRRLETLDPHNVVRLILPHDSNGTTYREAADSLRSWISAGVLVPDPAPALYVYEQQQGGRVQRGVIGTLDITPPPAGIVLPHESVVPEIVADRTELMRTAEANHDPLLLTHSGADQDGADTVDQVVRREPALETTTPDGVRHRLWATSDPAEIARIAGALAGSRALIADGHHRWAGYLRMQRSQHSGLSTAHRPTPWDRGLVLLVDTDRYPLRIQPIHRVLPRLTPQHALARLGEAGTVEEIAAANAAGLAPEDATAAALAVLGSRPEDANALVVAGPDESGRPRFHLLTRPNPQLLRRAVRPDMPLSWRRLDATILHRALIAQLWGVPDDPEHIGYPHDAASAVRQAVEANGTAVLLRPVTEAVVRDLAGQGVMMPRKSTSFGPKPATGLVLRDLRLG